MHMHNILVVRMEKAVKLNLGCGAVYRPGYVNIDLYDRSVADTFSDVEDLPYESNSVDEIVADQLVEHFDLVHCRYLFGEWFRALRPRGTLRLETPDLAATLGKFVKAGEREKESTLQWVFGIDSPGLQHKSGFTFDLLRRVLSETGFIDIKRGTAVTHTYEPGMRIECIKPARCDDAQFMAEFRRRLRRAMNLSDSFVMIPLEDWIGRIRGELLPLFTVDRTKVREIISVTAACNPKIPQCLLDQLDASGHLARSELSIESALLGYLVDKNYHERAYALWAKSKKSLDAQQAFSDFAVRLGRDIKDILERPEDRDKTLQYLLSLEPRHIDLFDMRIVNRDARTLLNLGIRRFSEQGMTEAVESLLESVRLNPMNPVAHWNLARIYVALGRGPEQIADEYEQAASLAPTMSVRKTITGEAREYGRHSESRERLGPVSEVDLA
jgi:predicted SAM-dependent methyltransferase/tetratricopeptide (TPR) repeat protein